MDHSKFQEAQHAYDTGDFRTAAKTFLASAGRGSAGNGSAYHMAGNALMRLRRYQDAITVYGHALRDDTYDRVGAVHANVGQAYSCLGEYADAVKAFEAALAEPDYPTPYKAWQGMASALLERNRVEEAAAAYRKAALDPANPDAGKALVNLGLCFMALGRPADAAEAYKAALGFDAYQGRGKALANLGQAYAAMGRYEEAIRAFEKSTQLHGHKLSASASDAYASAVEAIRPRHETVEGWVTGELPALVVDGEPEGWETGEIRALASDVYAESQPTVTPGPWPVPVQEPQHDGSAADEAADVLGFGDDDAVNEFFSRTDEDMRIADREARRSKRVSDREAGGWVRSAVTALIVTVLLIGAGVAAWWFGLGWPTQGTTVAGLMEAYQDGGEVEPYWVAVPEQDVAQEMAKMPPVKAFAIDGVARGRDVSDVGVTVTPEKGTPLRYVITLAREGVGWKVTGVENDWRSTGD